MAQASLSTGTRSHLLPVFEGLRGSHLPPGLRPVQADRISRPFSTQLTLAGMWGVPDETFTNRTLVMSLQGCIHSASQQQPPTAPRPIGTAFRHKPVAQLLPKVACTTFISTYNPCKYRQTSGFRKQSQSPAKNHHSHAGKEPPSRKGLYKNEHQHAYHRRDQEFHCLCYDNHP